MQNSSSVQTWKSPPFSTDSRRESERMRSFALWRAGALSGHAVMRIRLKEYGCSLSPKTALELLRRIQQLRAMVGNRAYGGISKTTPEQVDIFKALDVPTP